MVSFDLTEEHLAVEKMVRDWAGREVAPKIHDLDRERRFEKGFLKSMAELQLLGICIPEEYGGAGMDYISLGLVSEELEYVDTHLRVIMSVHVGLNSMTLWCWGTEDQKQRLPRSPGQGREDRDLRPHGAERGNRRRRHPDDSGEEGRPLRAERGEDLDQPGQHCRQLPRDRVDRSGEEEGARSQRPVRLHRRAQLRGLQLLLDEGEVGDPRWRYRRIPHGRMSMSPPRTSSAKRARASR